MHSLVFHIGFHKTGTTWMQSVLFNDNTVFNLLNNCLQPWNDELCINIIHKGEYEFNPELCRAIIENRSKKGKINIVSAERLSGHPISGGYDSELIAQRIKSISDNAKIIIITRNPKEFIPSVYRQLIKEGYGGTLKDYLIDYPWKSTGCPKKYLFQEKIVDYYRNLFGSENVLVLDFNLFKNDKPQFLDRLGKFIGLNDLSVSQEDLNKLVNKNRYSDRRLKALRYINRIRKTDYNPHPIIGLKSSVARKLSYPLSFFLTNRGLINERDVDEFLSEK